MRIFLHRLLALLAFLFNISSFSYPFVIFGAVSRPWPGNHVNVTELSFPVSSCLHFISAGFCAKHASRACQRETGSGTKANVSRDCTGHNLLLKPFGVFKCFASFLLSFPAHCSTPVLHSYNQDKMEGNEGLISSIFAVC